MSQIGYTEITPALKTIFESVSQVAAVYAHPQTKYSKYPSLVFRPAGLASEFDTTTQNKDVYEYEVYIIVGQTRGKTQSQLWEQVMPKVFDAVNKALAAGWDIAVAGRTTLQVVGGDWVPDNGQDGYMVVANMRIIITTLNSN